MGSLLLVVRAGVSTALRKIESRPIFTGSRSRGGAE
jgi:hypothetical protein